MTTSTAATRRAEADDRAVASFLLGLIGLVVFNVLCGPAAIVLGTLARRRGTARPGRAALGIALGVADLLVFALLLPLGGHGLSWHGAL